MARGRVPRRFPRSIAFVAVRLESAREGPSLPAAHSLFAIFSKNILLLWSPFDEMPISFPTDIIPLPVFRQKSQ